MLKSIQAAILLISSSLISFAAQAHDPIIPWPLDSARQEIALADIEGSWSAGGTELNLCLNLTASQPDTAGATLVLRDLEDSTQQVFTGWLTASNKSFLGEVANPDSRPFKILLLRSYQKLYLRLMTSDSKTRYFQLHKSTSCGI